MTNARCAGQARHPHATVLTAALGMLVLMTLGPLLSRQVSSCRYRRAARRRCPGPAVPVASREQNPRVERGTVLAGSGRRLRALKRLLEPGGRIATTYMPRSGDHTRAQAYAWSQKLERIMRDIGLVKHATHRLECATPAFRVVAGNRVDRSI